MNGRIRFFALALLAVILGCASSREEAALNAEWGRIQQMKNHVALILNPSYHSADAVYFSRMQSELEFLEKRGSGHIGGAIKDETELKQLKKDVSLASATWQVMMFSNPRLATISATNTKDNPRNMTWAVRAAKGYGNSAEEIVAATRINPGQLALALRAKANKYAMGVLTKSLEETIFLQFTEEVESIAIRACAGGQAHTD